MEKIAILTGGDSAEYNISLLSANTVLKHLINTKYNGILCFGQWNQNIFSGTDSWSYSVLAKGVFESFIAEQVKNYRHIIFEGDRLTSKVEWLTENYDTKVFILTTSLKEEQKRQEKEEEEERKNKLVPLPARSQHQRVPQRRKKIRTRR